jgi:small conductance mechanosensitive channel
MFTAYAASAADTAEGVANGAVFELASLLQKFIAQIPLIIAGIAVILLSFVVAKIVRNIVEGKMSEHIEDDHKEIQILGGRMSHIGILTIGITIGLKIAGIDLTAIIAAAAFGVGFALKDLIMNFLAGVMILVGRQFSIGDFIKIGNNIGKVVEIQSRVTILQAIDGTKVIVPNSNLFKKEVISFTSNPFRRIEILVGVEYRSNLDNVVKVCMKVLKNTKGVLIEPKPAVLLTEFADSSINLKLRAWVDSKGGWVKVKSNVILNLKKEFDNYGITIPWPIRTLAYDKDAKYDEKMLEEKIEEATVAEAKKEVAPQPVVTGSAKVEQVQVPSPVPIAIDNEQPLKPLREQRPTA